jgi:hypothetical protein
MVIAAGGAPARAARALTHACGRAPRALGWPASPHPVAGCAVLDRRAPRKHLGLLGWCGADRQSAHAPLAARHAAEIGRTHCGPREQEGDEQIPVLRAGSTPAFGGPAGAPQRVLFAGEASPGLCRFVVVRCALLVVVRPPEQRPLGEQRLMRLIAVPLGRGRGAFLLRGRQGGGGLPLAGLLLLLRDRTAGRDGLPRGRRALGGQHHTPPLTGGVRETGCPALQRSS